MDAIDKEKQHDGTDGACEGPSADHLPIPDQASATAWPLFASKPKTKPDEHGVLAGCSNCPIGGGTCRECRPAKRRLDKLRKPHKQDRRPTKARIVRTPFECMQPMENEIEAQAKFENFLFSLKHEDPDSPRPGCSKWTDESLLMSGSSTTSWQEFRMLQSKKLHRSS